MAWRSSFTVKDAREYAGLHAAKARDRFPGETAEQCLTRCVRGLSIDCRFSRPALETYRLHFLQAFARLERGAA